jgi:hypothetical protein
MEITNLATARRQLWYPFERRVLVAAAKVIVAIAAVVLFAHVQCVGACLAVLPGADLAGAGSASHCHKHPGDSNSTHNPSCCFRGVTVASATQPEAPQFSFPIVALGWAAPAAPVVETDQQFRGSYSFDSSPPPINLSVTILRV